MTYIGMRQEAGRLARIGQLGNSDAIRLLQIPHSPSDVKAVIRELAGHMSPHAMSKLMLESLSPLPSGVDNQRFEPLFDKYLISGRTYTTSRGTVVPNEIQYYNGRMVHLYGECSNTAAVFDALSGSGFRPVTLRYPDGREAALAQVWANDLFDTSLKPYKSMFVVIPAVRENASSAHSSIAADDRGISSVLAMFRGSFDPANRVYENSATLFFVRLYDTTQVAIDVGRERMGTDKRPGSVAISVNESALSLALSDGLDRPMVRASMSLSHDSKAFMSEVIGVASIAGLSLKPLPYGTEYVFPAAARIGSGPVATWQWRTDLIPRLYPFEARQLEFGSTSEEGKMLLDWGFSPRVLGYIPNVRGVITGLPEDTTSRIEGTPFASPGNQEDGKAARPICPAHTRSIENDVAGIADIQRQLKMRHPDLKCLDRVAHQYQIVGSKILLRVARTVPGPLLNTGLFVPSAEHIGIGRLSTGLGYPHSETEPDFLGFRASFMSAPERPVDFLGFNTPVSPADSHLEVMQILEAMAEVCGAHRALSPQSSLLPDPMQASVIKRLGPARGEKILRHIAAQRARTSHSSTAYQSYWTGVVPMNRTYGKFTIEPIANDNQEPSQHPGERYLTREWSQRQASGEVIFALFWIGFLDEDRTSLKNLIQPWIQSHKVFVGHLIFPRQDAMSSMAKLWATLASETAANPANWVSSSTDSGQDLLADFDYARKVAYSLSARGRDALPLDVYRTIFRSGEIDKALTDILSARRDTKRRQAHIDRAP